MQKSFENNSYSYSQARPGYPDELYSRIAEFKTFDKESHLLEIGAGHGVATEEASRHWGSKITAIEPGESLCEMGANRFERNGHVEFINTTFKDYRKSDLFDGIFSATAFHWIDSAIKFKKSHSLLKEGGLLALFWNYFTIESNEVFEGLQDIYRNYHPQEVGKGDPRLFTRKKIEIRRGELDDCDLFKTLDHWEFSHRITYSPQRYIQLLKTFPNNGLPDSQISPFFRGIHDFVKSRGAIEVTLLVCLDLGQKNNRPKHL